MISSKIFWHSELDKWLCTSFLFLHAMTSTSWREANWEEMSPKFEGQQAPRALRETWENSAFLNAEWQPLAISPFNWLLHGRAQWSPERLNDWHQSHRPISGRAKVRKTPSSHSLFFTMFYYMDPFLDHRSQRAGFISWSQDENGSLMKAPGRQHAVCLASLVSPPKELHSDERHLLQTLRVPWGTLQQNQIRELPMKRGEQP